MCDDAEDQKQQSLDEARESIVNGLRAEKSDSTVKTLIESVKKNHPVTLNEEYFKNAAQVQEEQPGQ
jgi:hypothetical protein